MIRPLPSGLVFVPDGSTLDD
ncbi:MAG: hypothetical protein GEV06_26895 [Luteitalea sp.]|nr:hypothetical protein [Luteitalea sp.]